MMLQYAELVSEPTACPSMSSSTSDFWIYFLAASSPWRASKKLTLFSKNLFLQLFSLLSFFLSFSFLPIVTNQMILQGPIYTLYVTYTTSHWHRMTPMQGATVLFCLFIQHIIANVNVFTIWLNNHTCFLKQFCVVVGVICLQASAMKWKAVRRLVFILDASPSNSPFIIASAFRMSCSLYWDMKAWMIPICSGCKWLVQFGEKNIT